MAGKDSTELVVGASGSILTADLGVAAPTDLETEWGEGWTDLGYATEDGVGLRIGRTVNALRGWQSFDALRRIVTERDSSVSFTLRQWNGENIRRAFGGGTIEETAPSSGVYRYEPPEPQDLGEHQLGVEWQDGDRTYRLILPKGMVTDDVETNITRTDSANLPMTFGITVDEGGVPWYLLTDDPAFAPPAE